MFTEAKHMYCYKLEANKLKIYTTCLMNYATFSFNTSYRTSQLLAAGLISLSIFITVGG
jgi:hypothetical protein